MTPTTDNDAPPVALDLEVFRTGDYGPKGRYTPDDLDRMATRYNTGAHEAPVTIDHATGGPAHGWVESLRRNGHVLVARIRNLSHDLARALRSGGLRKPSVELERAAAPGDAPTFRALSLLGAAIPEVKGLARPIFAEEAPAAAVGDEPPVRTLCVNFGDAPEAAPPDASLRIDAAIDRLRRAGRWLPAYERQGLRAFLGALAAVPVQRFAQGGDAPGVGDPLEWLAAFLASALPRVPLGEAAPTVADDAAHHGHAAFAADSLPRSAPHAEVLPESLALHRAAVRLMHATPALAYAEAVRMAARGTPAGF